MAEDTGACVPIECVVAGPLQNNIYLIGGADGLMVVDPGCEPQRILDAIGGRKVDAIVLTHGHWDHVGAAAALREATGAPVVAGAADAPVICGKAALDPSHRPFEPCPVDTAVHDGDTVEAGGGRWRVLETPGHTPGGICLFLDADEAEPVDGVHPDAFSVLVAGDTLFRGTHGRTDFEGGDPAAMERSLQRLAQLPPRTLVLPGHNDPTTIAAERRWIL